MTWEPAQYQLVDFGHGRKLEWFGGLLVDRPSPAAIGQPPMRKDQWPSANLRFSLNAESESGEWSPSWDQEGWQIRHGDVCLHLKTTPFGHLGVFPEQASNWDWLDQQVMVTRQELGAGGDQEIRCLNLFGYTGGATLTMAAAGGSVAHIDASRPAVQWARRNALLSHMEDLPIRWIVEDAMLFVERELRRQRRYELIVLDPPSFGRGPKGQRWQLQYDLPHMLMSCIQLLSDRPIGLLMTGHSEDLELTTVVEQACKQSGVDLKGAWNLGRSEISTSDGRSLDCGYFARWTARPDIAH